LGVCVGKKFGKIWNTLEMHPVMIRNVNISILLPGIGIGIGIELPRLDCTVNYAILCVFYDFDLNSIRHVDVFVRAQ